MNRILAVVAAVTFLTVQAVAQNNGADAGALIAAATKAMGTASLRSLQYTGTGSINMTGQAYTTGACVAAVHRHEVHDVGRLLRAAMRQELVRIDDAKVPRGGGAGGYNPQTFQGGIRPIPGDIIQNQTIDGRAQNGAIAFWLTPHGFLKGAAAQCSTAKASTARGKRTITFTAFGKFPITATLDNQDLIEHVEALVDIGFTATPVLDGTYSDYRSVDGVQLPMHIVMREGGWPTLDINVAQARPNAAEATDVVKRATSRRPRRRQRQRVRRSR
jgi:hypothetical protein